MQQLELELDQDLVDMELIYSTLPDNELGYNERDQCDYKVAIPGLGHAYCSSGMNHESDHSLDYSRV
jgi:hypothetical protein